MVTALQLMYAVRTHRIALHTQLAWLYVNTNIVKTSRLCFSTTLVTIISTPLLLCNYCKRHDYCTACELFFRLCETARLPDHSTSTPDPHTSSQRSCGVDVSISLTFGSTDYYLSLRDSPSKYDTCITIRNSRVDRNDRHNSDPRLASKTWIIGIQYQSFRIPCRQAESRAETAI